ncbi:hypothetical protein ABBQ38_007515 [Trebouxia sp. C0009 RCD-2024]
MEEQPDLPRPTLTAALEAADDLSILSTDANDQLLLPAFTCYVCNLPGSTNRLTTCMSAPVYQSLTAHSNQQLLDPATVASDTMLQHLLQPGRAGTLARQTEGARHCKRHFHQPCLGRRKEAVFDNRVTAVRNPGSDSPETRVKDLRHRLCGECLQAVQGSTDNMYSGLLDDEEAAAQAVRRADKLSSKMKKSLQARADKLGTLGCKVALTHLSRKGRVSQINSASLKQALQACTAEQQAAMQQQLQDKPDALLQLMKTLGEQQEAGQRQLGQAELAARLSDDSWHFVWRKKQRPEDRLLRMRS